MIRFRALSIVGAVALVACGVRAELADGIKAVVHDSVITYIDVEDQPRRFAMFC